MIADMPGYAAVQSWFVQAVPALGKYLTLDDTRTITCRLKIVAPGNSLHVTSKTALHYLSFSPNDVISPCQFSVDTTIVNSTFPNFWIRSKISSELRLFSPQSYRAPVIRGFDEFRVGGGQFGSEYNDDFAAVNWDIIAPFCQTVSHTPRTPEPAH